MSSDGSSSQAIPFDVPSVAEMSALLAQYEFEKLAAFGGMGAVYKARQASLDRPVAIKILPPAFGAEPEFAERFKSEARAMARLNHTNIVTVYDFGITSEGHLYLVMEWVEGHTIHELIQKGSIPVRKVANLAVQLCDALHFAHSHKILHRDIKPGNIMVNQEEQVKVADFGLARPITGEAEENPYGTPDYAAPEIMAKAAVDQRADIYAAGVVLYEMLTGRVPRSPRRSVTDFAPVSTRWDEIVAKATDPKPELRYQDVREMRTAIMMAVAQSSGAPLPVAVKVEEEHSRGRGLGGVKWAAMAAVLLVSAVGGAWVLRSVNDKVSEAGEQAENGPAKPRKPKKEKTEPVDEPAVPAVTATPAPENPPKPAEPSAGTPEPVKPAMPEKPALTVAPATEPMKPAEPAPAPMPAADDPQAILASLEEKDPEIVQLIAGFGTEWEANPEVNTSLARKDLTGKYIPALQRSLAGLATEQRDHVLSEISLVANNQPLREPSDTWPPVLKQLRQTYDAQVGAIESKAAAAAQPVRAAQSAALAALAQKRAAAGDAAGARRAEIVASALSKVQSAPSLQAIKQAAGGF